MASTITFDKSRAPFWGLLAAPFVAIGRFLVRLAEANPKLQQLERLNALGDAELARRGLTRHREIRRILGTTGVL